MRRIAQPELICEPLATAGNWAVPLESVRWWRIHNHRQQVWVGIGSHLRLLLTALSAFHPHRDQIAVFLGNGSPLSRMSC